jgi:capsid protein
MPFASQAQARFFNANRGKLERQGVDVDEWNHATDFNSLPERSMKSHNVDLGKKGSFHVKEGALHQMLHVSEGEKIGQARMRKATHSKNPTLRKRAIAGLGLSAMHHG